MKRGQIEKGSAWALVTGAGSGIGRCYAQRLAALGYNLIIVGNQEHPLRTAAEEIARQAGVLVRPLALDLARIDAAEELYEAVAAAGIEIDVLINNAGIFSFCDVLSTDEERIERILLLHDMTATKLCRRYAARMIER
ncbi:MAG: SDR family NAD(P)-dependent oxidoreductase, partial [Alistipes sp.]|nr:SDR family NAD(P)-dependent oxidoreductase [Alistipes sp.]